MDWKRFVARSGEAILGIAILGGAVVFYIHGASGRNANIVTRKPVIPLVRVAKIAPVEVNRSIEGIGTGYAKESVDITANATEKVVKLFFEDGQYVAGGTQLVQLSDDQFQAELAQAKINLAEQERELKRITPLYAARITSQKDYESAKTAVSRAKTAIDIVEYAIRNRCILAPFSGKLGMRLVSIGDLVSPGTKIVTIDDISEIKINFRVPEKYYPFLKPGQKVGVFSAAYPKQMFEGAITAISPRIDSVTRTAEVRAIVKNPDAKLAPGMLFVVKLELGKRKALQIPEKSVMSLGEIQYIFVYSPATQKVSRRVVRLGQRENGMAEVMQGLKEGEIVVTDGILKLSDKTPVNIRKEESAK